MFEIAQEIALPKLGILLTDSNVLLIRLCTSLPEREISERSAEPSDFCR